jgi:PEP-CTERM motif
MKRFLAIVVAVLALGASVPAHAGFSVYNLANDWSDASNPNGVWAYQVGAGLLSASAGLPIDPWTTPQPGWAVANSIPVMFKSNGTENFAHDWIKGDVIAHSGSGTDFASSVSASWTSPIAGTVDILGHTWKTRNIGRSNVWGLYLNGVQLTGGLLASGDSNTRATPFLFADGSGGAGVLQDVAVAVGDIISFRLTRAPNSPAADYAGIDLQIEATFADPVPEPSTLVLLATGGLAFFGYRFGKRSRA